MGDMKELKELLLRLHMESNLGGSTTMLNSLVQELNSCKSETQTMLDILLLPFRWRLRKKQFFSCPNILEFLKHIRGKKKFKASVKEDNFLKFRMVESNIEKSVKTFEDLEKSPSKFICINNDRDNKKTKINKIVSAIQLQFYLNLFPAPSKFEKKDPSLEDPIHTKPKVKCSISEPKMKIYCVENTGKRFDLNMTVKKPKTYWDDPEWSFLRDWQEYKGENNDDGFVKNKPHFLPNIAGFITGSVSNSSENQQSTKTMANSSRAESRDANKQSEKDLNAGDIDIHGINDFFKKMKEKREKELNT